MIINLKLNSKVTLECIGNYIKGTLDENYDRNGEPGTPGVASNFEFSSINLVEGDLLDLVEALDTENIIIDKCLESIED